MGQKLYYCPDCRLPILKNGCPCNPIAPNPRPEKPTPPPCRTIREGEPTCWTCGGGKDSHRFGALGHPFEGRTPNRKPRFDAPLSLSATCLILGLIVGVIAGLILGVVLRHAWA